MKKKDVFLEKFRINSGVLRVARGGSGAKVPPLAARPGAWEESLDAPYHRLVPSLFLCHVSGV